MKLFLSLRKDDLVWTTLSKDNAADQASSMEPQDLVLHADERRPRSNR